MNGLRSDGLECTNIYDTWCRCRCRGRGTECWKCREPPTIELRLLRWHWPIIVKRQGSRRSVIVLVSSGSIYADQSNSTRLVGRDFVCNDLIWILCNILISATGEVVTYDVFDLVHGTSLRFYCDIRMVMMSIPGYTFFLPRTFLSLRRPSIPEGDIALGIFFSSGPPVWS